MTEHTGQSQLLNGNRDRTNLFNSFDTNFYTNSYEDVNKDQSACHLIANPVSLNSVVGRRSDRLTPSGSREKQLFNSRPSTICYRTFKDGENSPFSSPLKRSSTFAGVFNTFFKPTDYDHLLEPYLNDGRERSNKFVRYTKSYYDDENRFTSSEPLSNEQRYRQLIATTSTTSLLPNLMDIQSIKQSLLSMAVVLTKHSSSNLGRILEAPQRSKRSLQINERSPNSPSIPNSLSNSASTASTASNTPSSSLYTNNEASTVVALQGDPSFSCLNFCTLCLQYVESNEVIILDNCKCGFCRPCLEQYCTIIIRDHSLTSCQITCPSSDCPNANSYLTTEQIERLVDESTFKLYEKIKLDLEVHLDPNRVWCPRPNCETVCTVPTATKLSKIENDFDSSNFLNASNVRTPNNQKQGRRVPVNCENCNLTFCLHCKCPYRPDHGK